MVKKYRIYKITQLSTNRYYVGQTTLSLNRRFSGHKCSPDKTEFYQELRKNPEDFQIELLEEFVGTTEEANLLEEKYMKDLESIWPKGFNRLPFGGHKGSPPEYVKELYRKPKPRRAKPPKRGGKGIPLGEKNKINIGLALRGKNSKLTEKQVKEIKILLRDTELYQREIAERYNVARGTILSIFRGDNWKYVVISDEDTLESVEND